MADRWEQAAREDLAPKVASSAYVMAIAAAGDVDPKQALELGYAILLDKPLVVVVPAGRQPPPGLARIARRVVQLRHGPDTPQAQQQLMAELGSLHAELGIAPSNVGGASDG
jgi:hypothetical protein